MKVDKNELANMLYQISSFEKSFKARAFNDAGDIISVMDEDKFNEHVINKDFIKIRGIGNSVNKCILEYIETGSITRLSDHMSSSTNLTDIYDQIFA